MEFVLVALLSDQCEHCPKLLSIWNDVTKELLKVYPGLRFPVSTIDTMKYKHPPIMIKNQQINENLFPKDLLKYYHLWTPITLLVPSKSWDFCCSEAGKGTTLQGVYIMNSVIKNGNIAPMPIYNPLKPEEFGIWLKDILNNQPKKIEEKKEANKNICDNIIHNLISRK